MRDVYVANAREFRSGDRKIVRTAADEIGVFNSNGVYYAYSNYCVHAGGPACEGIMINKVEDLIDGDRAYQGQTFTDEEHFVCPWHGYEYDLKTGECVGDRRLKLKKYAVVRRGEDLFIIV